MRSTAVAHVCSCVLVMTGLSAQAWQVQQLTDNNAYDVGPLVAGEYISWARSPGTSQHDILLYDGTEIKYLSDSPNLDYYHFMSNTHVAWQHWYPEQDEYEVWVYDIAAGTTTVINEEGMHDEWIGDMDDRYIVWSGDDDERDRDIYLYDTADGSIDNLSDSEGYAYQPRIYGSNVVWHEKADGTSAIWRYNLETQQLQRLSDTAIGRAYGPELSGTHVVWEQHDGNDFEVFAYDLINGGDPIQLTDNDIDDMNLRISGGNVIWSSGDKFDPRNWDLNFYNGTETKLLGHDVNTHNIDGMNIVWDTREHGDSEIMYYNILTDRTYTLTDNGYNDFGPQIDGSTIVWYAKVDNEDTEILKMTIPEPTTLLLFLLLPMFVRRRTPA